MEFSGPTGERIISDVRADLGRAYPTLPEKLLDFYRASTPGSTFEEEGEIYQIPLQDQIIHSQTFSTELGITDDYGSGDSTYSIRVSGKYVGTATYLATLLRKGDGQSERPMVWLPPVESEPRPLRPEARDFLASICVEAFMNNADRFAQYGIHDVDTLLQADLAPVREAMRQRQIEAFERARVGYREPVSLHVSWPKLGRVRSS